MTDKERVIEVLDNNITEKEEQKFLRSICNEVFKEYDKGSAKAVSELLQGKINPLKNKFDDAHTKFLKKMGL